MKVNQQKKFVKKLLERNFVADRNYHLQLVKDVCKYVFSSGLTKSEADDLKESIVHGFELCNMQVDESILLDFTKLIITTWNMREYSIIVTDAWNKQVMYTNTFAKIFLYDAEGHGQFCSNGCVLLRDLVGLELQAGMEHHMEMKCKSLDRTLWSDSFVFQWQGKDNIIHFVSDETNHLICEKENASEEEKIQLLEKLYIDPMTNCYNKRYAYAMLEQLLYEKTQFAVVIVNINSVGYVNKKYSYELGNDYIKNVVGWIEEKMREYDFLARMEGDQFLLILKNCSEIDATLKLKEINIKIKEKAEATNFGLSYGIKEVDESNVLNLLEVINEVKKKMNFYKQLHRIQHSNYDEQFMRNNKERIYEKEDMYMTARDSNFHIANLAQYEKDKERMGFDKIFIGRVETADITIAVSGSELYYESSRDILGIVEAKLDPDIMRLYCFDYKTFMIAAVGEFSKDAFIVGMRQMSEQFSFATSGNTGISGVVRFAVVTNHENLLETGLALLIEKQKEHGNFFVYDENEHHGTLLDESNAIEVIQNAISNHGLVPYYQGIRNNNTGKFDTYESLMRIVDGKGRVYAPYFFLDIAKKYKFYEQFTFIMIEQVLADFYDRSEKVSMNVTTSDVKSEKFRTWFYKQIENFSEPKRLILEIVEAEEYDNDEVLVEFMKTVRSYGVKIAIDDFGAGYSNLGKVINLKPDIIKIDGSIIKNICDDQHSAQVLNVIVSMAKILNAYVVAEYIENEEIQEVIEGFDIPYSQGYLYAQPKPYDRI